MRIQTLYHLLPDPLKNVSASMFGFYLKNWRYGKQTEEIIQETLERDLWTDGEWDNYRAILLDIILDNSAKKVPYYRNYWQEKRKNGDRASWAYLENWPILEKTSIRMANRMFLVDEPFRFRYYFKDHTGGTTGTPLTIYETKKTTENWYGIFEARLRRWHHVSITEPWGIFGGQLVTPLIQTNPPFWVENKSLNQIYYSTFHISESNTKYYVESFNKFKLTHLIAYPSSLYLIARYMIKLKIPAPELISVIFSNAEGLTLDQRLTIEKAFNCKVINTYGMGEKVAAASECEHKNLHTWPEVGFIEGISLNDGSFVTNGFNGLIDYVVTGLLNFEMPLIRYKIGDVGDLPAKSTCICGKSLPTIDHIRGRNTDLITTKDGRKVFWLNSIFYDRQIIEAQIIQETFDHFTIKLVPELGFNQSENKKIIDSLKSRVGDVRVDVQVVDSIPRTKAGKFKAVISKVNNA